MAADVVASGWRSSGAFGVARPDPDSREAAPRHAAVTTQASLGGAWQGVRSGGEATVARGRIDEGEGMPAAIRTVLWRGQLWERDRWEPVSARKPGGLLR